MQTPWGLSQMVRSFGLGITWVSTASHGGFHLAEEQWKAFREKFPGFMPWAGPGWFEEDEEWAMVVLAFAEHFEPATIADAVRTVRWKAKAEQARDEGRRQWQSVEGWLHTSEEGRQVLATAELEEQERACLWECSGCSTIGVKKGWSVLFHRGEERRELIMPDYPAKRFYTDAELSRLVSAGG